MTESLNSTLNDSTEGLVYVEITYVDDTAENVLCYTSQDDFKEGIAMSLKEGSEELWLLQGYFTPGRLLYRFYVDREWMCDENKEVITVRGDSYNEIDVEGDDEEVEGDSSAISAAKAKKRAKRKRWRQKKKMLKARRRALQSMEDEKGDPKEQAERLAAALKSFESSQVHQDPCFCLVDFPGGAAIVMLYSSARFSFLLFVIILSHPCFPLSIIHFPPSLLLSHLSHF